MSIVVDERDKKFVHVLKLNKDAENPDIGIVGVPFDGATRGRPGARFGPQKIRSQLNRYSAYCVEYREDISNLKIRDFGDLNLDFGSVELAHSHIEENLKRLLDISKALIVLGGDHSITYPSIGALIGVRADEVGLVVIDAHHDLRELEEGRVSSGTVIEDIIKQYGDKLKPNNIVQIGIRGFVNSKYYVEKAEKLGINYFTAIDVRKIGIRNVIRDILDNILEDVDIIYFSFDVDGVDIAFAPGVNAPSSGGLLPEDVFSLSYNMGKSEKTVIMDVTEFAPTYDIADMTADLIANSILYFICGFSRRTK